MIRFEWDDRKDLSNRRKHGIAFDEASAVFNDSQAVVQFDRVVDGEERWQITGLIRGTVLLLVVHTIREHGISDELLRIISARTATASERHTYEVENRLLHS